MSVFGDEIWIVQTSFAWNRPGLSSTLRKDVDVHPWPIPDPVSLRQSHREENLWSREFHL